MMAAARQSNRPIIRQPTAISAGIDSHQIAGVPIPRTSCEQTDPPHPCVGVA